MRNKKANGKWQKHLKRDRQDTRHLLVHMAGCTECKLFDTPVYSGVYGVIGEFYRELASYKKQGARIPRSFRKYL
jgi:hypothetical protein